MCLVNHLVRWYEDLCALAGWLNVVLDNVHPVRLVCLDVVEDDDVGESVAQPIIEVLTV
jgi:hypothetical protein